MFLDLFNRGYSHSKNIVGMLIFTSWLSPWLFLIRFFEVNGMCNCHLFLDWLHGCRSTAHATVAGRLNYVVLIAPFERYGLESEDRYFEDGETLEFLIPSCLRCQLIFVKSIGVCDSFVFEDMITL